MKESKKAIPEPNFFQCPNIIIDEYLKELSGSELKCFLFIVRKTKGWHKDVDAISISQFEEFTGLSNRAVIDACNSLVERGFIFQDVGQRGIKLFTLDCKKFTCEKSSHVKKVHSTYEESSQVTSEKSSHTKDTIKNTNINKNNISDEALNKTNEPKNGTVSEQDYIDKITTDNKPKNFALPLNWNPDKSLFNGYCVNNGIAPNQLTNDILKSFCEKANANGEVKSEAQWCLYLAKYLKTCLNNLKSNKPNPHFYQHEQEGTQQESYKPNIASVEVPTPLNDEERKKRREELKQMMGEI